MPETGQVVLAVGIDDRHGRRQVRVDLMMVDHHGVEAEPRGLRPARRSWSSRNRRTTTSRAPRPGELARWHPDWGRSPRRCGRGYRPVHRRPPARRNRVSSAAERRAVDVVVAEDGDRSRRRRPRRRCGRLPPPCRSAPRDRASASLESRIEEGRHVVRGNAAAGQHPRDDVGDAVPLGDRQGLPRGAVVEPLAPSGGRSATARRRGRRGVRPHPD